MNTLKKAPATVADAQATTVATSSQTKPAPAAPPIHWAGAGGSMSKVELEQKFEAMRARNWITDRMVQQYQKHWHCTREAALERLLAKVGA